MTESTRREGHDDVTRREVPDAVGTRREVRADATRRELDGGGGDLASSLGQFGLLAQVPSLAERYILDRDATQKLGPEGGQAQLAVVREANSADRLVLKVYSRGTSLDERAMDKLIEMGRDPVGAQHVLPILDTGIDPHSGLTWEVQEYMTAGSLEQLFAQQTITPDFATALTREMSAALTFVHARGVTHRDLKPGNILIRTLQPLDVVVADFGLAIQQDMSVVVKSVAGSWPYLPPESRANEFTPAMDWWALGLILAKGLTGRHMFQEPDGPRMLDDATIANQLARRTYTIPATGDERWDLLIAGLLTAEYRHRWSTAEVEDWLAGGTPEVHASPSPDLHPTAAISLQPFAFAGADYDTPAALAAGFRTKWQEAGDLLIGRGREDLLTWLRRTPVGTTADAILDRNDLRNPEAPLLRLQVLLDPATIPAFRGQTLSTAGFNTIIDQARNGDTKAINWITGLRKERILSAWAGEIAVPAEIRRADDLLRGWWNNVENLLSKVPGDQSAQLRPALEAFLLEAALNPTARDRVSEAGQRVAAEASVLPDWAAPIKAAATDPNAGPEHAALALATLPAAERTETARLKGVREAEQRREREQREEQQRQRQATTAAAAARGAANRRAFDWLVIVLAVAACVTVLVPWLIGRFALRENFGRTTSGEVFDAAVRKAGDYFLTDWISGMSAVLFIAGAIILLGRYWARRPVSIAVALAMVGAALFLLGPIAVTKWKEAEAHSVTALETTEFPFGDRYKTCGSETLTFKAADGHAYPISAFSAHISGTPDEGCNRVEIYRGWCLLKTINLPSGQWISDGMFSGDMSSNADDRSLPASQIVFLAELTTGKSFKVPLKNVDMSKTC